jgi:hypothetical protein
VVVRIVAAVMVERVSVDVLARRGALHPPSFLSAFLRWDAGHYQNIVTHGYQAHSWWEASFYPLYPLVVHGVANIGHFGPRRAALAVSWVALWAGCWGVIRFTADVFPAARAWRGGMLLAFFPASVFLLAGYAESLFVALAAWTLVALAERRVWVAAGLCALAAATRPEGALLAVAVIVWALTQGIKRKQHLAVPSATQLFLRLLGLGLVCVSGLVAFWLFLWRRYHHPFAAISAQHAWRRVVTWPLHPLFWSLNAILGRHIRGSASASLATAYLFNDAVVVFAVIALAVLVGTTWRRWDLYWFVVPSVAALLVIVSNAAYGQIPEGEARLVMCIVPLYAVTAKIRSEVAWTALFAGSAVSAALFQAVFNTGGWLT